MSNNNFYDQQAGNQNLQSNNPYSGTGGGNNAPPASYGDSVPQYGNAPPQQQHHGYQPPPGPPPGQAPHRSDTFKEGDFVPAGERGEQREAMQQFEMNRSGNESKEDRDVAMLQQEYPSVDSSLIAALYSDTQDTGATREMLQELTSHNQGGQGS